MIFFIFEFLRIACTTERFLINDVLLLKNNFWKEDGSQIKTKEGYLFYVSVEIVDSKHSCFGDRCLPNISYYDSKNGEYLSVFKPRTSKEILSRLKNGQEVVLKFNFEFTDCPLLELNDFYIKKIDHFENYKILIKESENSIKFKVYSSDLYLIRIEQSIPIFFDNKFVILEKFDFDNVLIDQNLKIKLLYFESINSCLESFKKFVNHFNCLKIKDDTEEYYCESDLSNNILKVSDLKNDLQFKFNDDFKRNEDKFIDKYQFIERLFEEYCFVLIK